MADETTDNSEQVRMLAELRLHRALEAAHGEFARALAGMVERDVTEAPDIKGAVQRRILRLPALATEAGLTAGEVSGAVAYDEANIYAVLGSLEKSGMLEVGGSPKRWRLTLKHRRNRILRVSRLVPEGRWTTYGDFAIAVYDNWQMARTVGQVAAKNPAFAHPHRVIKSGGVIPEGWRDDEGKGPEECQRRLEEEGVRFVDGRADPERFIGWEELRGLLDASEADVDEAA